MASKAWAVAAFIGVGAALYLARSDAPAPAQSPDVLVNRIWIDALPTSPKQKVDVLLLVDPPRIGQFLHSSAFEGDFSLFEWRDRDAGRLEIVMLQSEKRHRLSVSIATEGCAPFDYCMKVKGAPRGAKKYYSMRDWVIEPGRAIDDAAVRELLAAQAAGR